MAILEQPPASLPEEVREYLARINAQVAYELNNSDQAVRYTDIPNKLSIGKSYYFLNAVPAHPVVTAEGLYLYKSTGFVLLG